MTNLTDCNTSGCGSLRAAVEAVNADTSDTSAPGDSIVFASGLTGTITLSNGDLYLYRDATVTAPGAGALTLVPKAGSDALYAKGADVSISGITFTGGNVSYQGGAIYARDAKLALDHCVVTGNTATYGGGIWSSDGGDLTITDSTISDNVAKGHSYSGGGGVVAASSNLYVSNSTIADNFGATYAGGTSSFYGKQVISNSTIAGNQAPSGAGTEVFKGTETLTGDTVAANTIAAGGQGGQAAAGTGGSLTLDDSIVSGSGTVPDVAIYGTSASAQPRSR